MTEKEYYESVQRFFSKPERLKDIFARFSLDLDDYDRLYNNLYSGLMQDTIFKKYFLKHMAEEKQKDIADFISKKTVSMTEFYLLEKGLSYEEAYNTIIDNPALCGLLKSFKELFVIFDYGHYYGLVFTEGDIKASYYAMECTDKNNKKGPNPFQNDTYLLNTLEKFCCRGDIRILCGTTKDTLPADNLQLVKKKNINEYKIN